MLRKISMLVLLCVCGTCLLSCTHGSGVDDTTTPNIESTAAESTGEPRTLEEMQNRYPEYNIFSLDAYENVRYNPDGTPNPKKPVNIIPETASAEGVSVEAVNPTVAGDFEKIKFKLTKEKKSDDDEIYFCTVPRIDRYENGAWKRLYYLPYSVMTGYEWPETSRTQTVNSDSGAMLEGAVYIEKDCCISPLTPGKYRAVVFVGYEPTPLYAEFTVE